MTTPQDMTTAMHRVLEDPHNLDKRKVYDDLRVEFQLEQEYKNIKLERKLGLITRKGKPKVTPIPPPNNNEFYTPLEVYTIKQQSDSNGKRLPAFNRYYRRRVQLASKRLRGEVYFGQEGIDDIYKMAHELSKSTGYKWHVDHVIPINGKYVTGLHVAHNLKVIPASYNHRKSNKFEPLMVEFNNTQEYLQYNGLVQKKNWLQMMGIDIVLDP
jgi:hypothetical protein